MSHELASDSICKNLSQHMATPSPSPTTPSQPTTTTQQVDDTTAAQKVTANQSDTIPDEGKIIHNRLLTTAETEKVDSLHVSTIKIKFMRQKQLVIFIQLYF